VSPSPIPWRIRHSLVLLQTKNLLLAFGKETGGVKKIPCLSAAGFMRKKKGVNRRKPWARFLKPQRGKKY